MFLLGPREGDIAALRAAIGRAAVSYHTHYGHYYNACAPPTRRHYATPIRRSSSFPASGCSGLQGQAGSAHHVGVLRQCDPRDGGRGCADDAEADAGGPALCRTPGVRTIRRVRAVPQLRRAATPRGFPHRYWALEEAKLQRMPRKWSSAARCAGHRRRQANRPGGGPHGRASRRSHRSSRILTEVRAREYQRRLPEHSVRRNWP